MTIVKCVLSLLTYRGRRRMEKGRRWESTWIGKVGGSDPMTPLLYMYLGATKVLTCNKQKHQI